MNENARKPPYLVYGFDAGIASLGWCIIDLANNRIVATNVRLYDDPTEPKSRVSLAAHRSEMRRARRLRTRRADRRGRCLRLCEAYGLVTLPHDTGGALAVKQAGRELQRRPGEGEVLELRAKGLSRLLSGRELARILYWLCAHRGYIPHGTPSDTDGRQVLTAVDGNVAAMSKGGFATIGEYLFSRLQAEPEKGYRNKQGTWQNSVPDSALVDEVREIFKRQRGMGSELASEELEERFTEECLIYLTSTTRQERSIYERVSPCMYFKSSKKAAAKCCLSFEMERAWEALRNARILDELGRERPLADETVETAMRILFSPVAIKGNKSCTVKWSSLRKIEDLSGRASFKKVKPSEEATCAPASAPAWALLRDSLDKQLLEKLLEDRELADAVGSALAYASRTDSLAALLDGDADAPSGLPDETVAQFAKLSDEEREQISGIDCTSKLFSGYGTRSAWALRILVDAFERGARTLADAEDAVKKLIDEQEEEEKKKGCFLGCYEKYDPTCNNPVVLRAMSQFRKVLNSLIAEYGQPAEIHIELARELKIPASARAKIERSNGKRRAGRDKLRKQVSGWLRRPEADIPRKLLDKLELFEEQEGLDAYTGDGLDRDKLLHDPTYAEIDHILPYSRSLDDSRANKVLVLAKSNQDKGNRTPYEWMTSGEASAPSWEAFCAQVQGRRESMSARKAENLTCRDFAHKESEFIKRNLNDTRYMTTKMAQWVEDELLFSDSDEAAGESGRKHVRTPSGGVTSMLRYCWGFAKKDRAANELHHAVDAAIIAACNQSIVQKVAIAHSSKHHVPKERYREMLAEAQPWEGFADDVESAVARAVPSRKANRSLTGRLFEETFYRLEGETEKGLGILSTGKGTKKKRKNSGNYIVLPSGSVVKPDRQAYLRLWWDPEAKARGRAEPGKWLAEVVYYSDLSAVKKKAYVPRAARLDLPRTKWEPVPARAMETTPIALHQGDILLVKGEPRIYTGFAISTCTWMLAYPDRSITDKKACLEATKGLSIGTCGRDDIRIPPMSVLGWPGSSEG